MLATHRLCNKRGKIETIARHVPEAQRSNIFIKYWRITWDQRKIYMTSRVTYHHVRRGCRLDQTNTSSHRNFSFKYSIIIDLKAGPVCKNFFLCTLNMKTLSIQKWSLCGADKGIVSPLKQMPRRSNSDINKSLVKMPSHYCCAESNNV